MCFLFKDVENTGSKIWNYYKFYGAQSKQEVTFCDTSLTGRAALVQKKANDGACFPIREKDNNQYVDFNIV